MTEPREARKDPLTDFEWGALDQMLVEAQRWPTSERWRDMDDRPSEGDAMKPLHAQNVGRRVITFDNHRTETIYAVAVDHPSGRWEQIWVLRSSEMAERVAAALNRPNTVPPAPSDVGRWIDSLHEDAFVWATKADLRASLSRTSPDLDVERLGLRELLDVADAILTKYPPDTIVCSHSVKADIGARTVAGIADLITSCRAALATTQPERRDGA